MVVTLLKKFKILKNDYIEANPFLYHGIFLYCLKKIHLLIKTWRNGNLIIFGKICLLKRNLIKKEYLANFGQNLSKHLNNFFQFDNQRLRCVRKETVSCSKKPDLTKIHLEPQGVKLRLSDLDSFFSRFSFSSIISA